ncbi:MAG: hypothetical protein DRM97_01320 [Thermoprotei archaeon]|nr:MAG: hypothetical protein DRM97_01320 [Thermoprotei archaeon]
MSFKKKGVTGIQTAIIMIAFIVVASVLAFAVLNMGLSATQRAQEVGTRGLRQAASALQLHGSVIGYDKDYDNEEPGNRTIDLIEICVKLAPGNEPIDVGLGKLTISYTNTRLHVANIYDGTNATIKWVTFIDYPAPDDLLEAGEVAMIVIDLGAIDATNAPLSANEWFKIEIKPPVGAILVIERTTPPGIDPVNDLG